MSRDPPEYAEVIGKTWDHIATAKQALEQARDSCPKGGLDKEMRRHLMRAWLETVKALCASQKAWFAK